MQLIARKTFRYCGRQLEVGDAFEAIPRDAQLFVLLGKAGKPEPEPERHEQPKHAHGAAHAKAPGPHDAHAPAAKPKKNW